MLCLHTIITKKNILYPALTRNHNIRQAWEHGVARRGILHHDQQTGKVVWHATFQVKEAEDTRFEKVGFCVFKRYYFSNSHRCRIPDFSLRQDGKGDKTFAYSRIGGYCDRQSGRHEKNICEIIKR
jgi:hypothetical protein